MDYYLNTMFVFIKGKHMSISTEKEGNCCTKFLIRYVRFTTLNCALPQQSPLLLFILFHFPPSSTLHSTLSIFLSLSSICQHTIIFIPNHSDLLHFFPSLSLCLTNLYKSVSLLTVQPSI